MKTVYTTKDNLESYFREAEKFLESRGITEDNGEKIIFEGDDKKAVLDKYVKYLPTISKLDEKNEYKHLRQPKYHWLFKEAEDILKDMSGDVLDDYDGIYDLATYFKYLDILIKVGGPMFLRIPFEEDCFEIDANTRTINPPQELKKNQWVIGVKDDQYAEIIWFHIDRYYDGQDLAICFPLEDRPDGMQGYGQTYIQWQNGSNYGLSQACYPDYDEENIYFGWYLNSLVEGEPGPLNNSGNLKFSVRFQYHVGGDEDGPELNSKSWYSFNTQECTVTVLPNLIDSMILDNSENKISKLTPESVADQPVSRPRFSSVFDSSRGAKAYIPEDGDLVSPVDLDPQTKSVTLTIQARSVNNGKLAYRWYHDGTLVKESDFDNPKEGDNSYTITYTGDAPVIGDYWVQVGNKEITNNETGAYKVRWTTSSFAEMPGPSKINIAPDGDLVARAFVGEDEYCTLHLDIEKDFDEYGRQTGDLVYDWYRTDLKGNNVEQIICDTNEYTTNQIGRYYVEVTNVWNGAEETLPKGRSGEASLKARPQLPTEVEIERIGDTNTLRATVTIDHDNDLYYKWQNTSINGHSTTWELGADQYVADKPGIYQCYVTQIVFDEWAPADPKTNLNYVSSNQVNIE